MNMILITACALAVTAQDEVQTTQSADLRPAAEAITTLLRAHHYDPRELDSPTYQALEAEIIELGESATGTSDFLSGFAEIWQDAPFSHVNLAPAQGTAADMAAFVDTMRVGGGGATLSWQGETAILNVTTMMGQDTIEEINSAYQVIAERGADALVIDLRANGGGAFAVLPLVEHVITDPLDAGVFVSQPWNDSHDRAPDASDLVDVDAWRGWSLRTFWASVQTDPLTVIRFEPAAENRFEGPVYVLTSATTASAAEMAADALSASGRAVLIGEQTAGEMLSQTVFDVPGNLQLWLPIADYHSLANGRIEGVGVTPDILTDAARADMVAFQLIAND